MAKKKRHKHKSDRSGEGSSPPHADLPEDMPSLSSLEKFLSAFGEWGRKRTPLDEAQDLVYDAWEAGSIEEAVAMAEEALCICADCADAYNLLAEAADSLEEATKLYRRGVAAGERALGERTFKEDAGYFWGLIETRPYMRTRAGLAQCLWMVGQREEAVEHYQDMLRLNPNDNQGIREMLMPCLIELGRDEQAEKLFKRYEEDGMAVWMYSRALLDFRKSGDSAAAGRSLEAAIEENEHVPAYLLGRKRMPRQLPDYHGFGDENEAIRCTYLCMGAWEATPRALEWLAANAA
ncbi:MAG: tetratricopeptide repeat protein [Planctomycetota bacterium]